jgi:hypothetical protein
MSESIKTALDRDVGAFLATLGLSLGDVAGESPLPDQYEVGPDSVESSGSARPKRRTPNYGPHAVRELVIDEEDDYKLDENAAPHDEEDDYKLDENAAPHDDNEEEDLPGGRHVRFGGVDVRVIVIPDDLFFEELYGDPRAPSADDFEDQRDLIHVSHRHFDSVDAFREAFPLDEAEPVLPEHGIADLAVEERAELATAHWRSEHLFDKGSPWQDAWLDVLSPPSARVENAGHTPHSAKGHFFTKEDHVPVDRVDFAALSASWRERQKRWADQ